jgi:hypothetical protein
MRPLCKFPLQTVLQVTLESVFFEDLDSSKRTPQPAIRSWVSKAKPRRSQSLWKFGVLLAILLVRYHRLYVRMYAIHGTNGGDGEGILCNRLEH